MTDNPFQVGGALLATSPVYIERQADKEALFHLGRMNYITLVEPRQQGKTSLLNRLVGQVGASEETPDRSCFFATVDLTTWTELPEKSWYEELCKFILCQLWFISADQQPQLPTNNSTWLSFLTELGKIAKERNIKIVIALDEVGAVPTDWATGFFSAIRSIYNYRQNLPVFRHLTFILAGAYNPRTLINDDKVSPFNIAQQIYIPDFTLEQVSLLTVHLIESAEIRMALAERIHYWSDGQPYLTQWLCRALVGHDLTCENVDAAVEQLRREDNNHLPHVFNTYSENREFDEYVRRVASGNNPAFTPAELPRQMKLALAGIIKADSKGRCKIRNRIYEQVLACSLEDYPKNPNVSEVSMMVNYNIGSVRELLLAAFTTEELRRFCFDDRRFKPVYDEFSSGMGKTEVVDRILEFSQNNSLMAELLQMVKQQNPRQFANFEARLYLAKDETSSPLPLSSSNKVPKPQPAPTSAMPSTPDPWAFLKFQLADLAGLEFNVRGYDTPIGEVKVKGQLPYDATGLVAVLKSLHAGSYDPANFSETQQQTLQKLGLLHGSRFTANMLDHIGQGLYQALFSGKAGSALDMALNQARVKRGIVGLQLRFDAEAVDLARYPWELLHDGHRALLSSGAVELTRYISYAEAPTPLTAAPPWRLLYITARPSNISALPPDQERQTVLDSLQSLKSEGKLIIESLTPPTYDKLLDTLSATDYHIIHFDGHGVFAKKCPHCEAMNQAYLTECAICQDSLTDVQPGGFLAFEDEKGRVDYVDTSALENALFGNQVRLAVISACVSATVRGETLFGGVGPGLIRAGIPAVVAMQLPIPVKSAINFAKGFYTALTQGESIPRAVAQGRRRLFRDGAYFIPTLYLRSSDDEGKLFNF